MLPRMRRRGRKKQKSSSGSPQPLRCGSNGSFKAPPPPNSQLLHLQQTPPPPPQGSSNPTPHSRRAPLWQQRHQRSFCAFIEKSHGIEDGNTNSKSHLVSLGGDKGGVGGSSPSVPNPPGNGKHCTVVLSDPRAALSLQESSESSAVFDHRQTRVPLSFLYTGRFTLQLPPPHLGFYSEKEGNMFNSGNSSLL